MTEANGLGHNDVRCLHQDRSGALWVGTAFGGVSKFVSSALAHVTERDGLRSRIVSAVRRTPDGTLWFGTYGGGVARIEGLKVQNYGVEEGLSDLFVRALWNLPTGEVIVGTEHSGAFVSERSLLTHRAHGARSRERDRQRSGRAHLGGR